MRWVLVSILIQIRHKSTNCIRKCANGGEIMADATVHKTPKIREIKIQTLVKFLLMRIPMLREQLVLFLSQGV